MFDLKFDNEELDGELQSCDSQRLAAPMIRLLCTGAGVVVIGTKVVASAGQLSNSAGIHYARLDGTREPSM